MNQTYPICVPIKYGSKQDIIESAEYALEAGATMVELWLDQLPKKGMTKKRLEKLFEAVELPILAVCKSKNEKGDFVGTDKDRVAVLIDCIELSVDIVDVSIDVDEVLIKKVIQKRDELGGLTQVVLSYHNFESTNNLDELKSIVDKAVELEADIVKVATMSESHEDNNTMLSLLEYTKSKGIKAITLCMGAVGQSIRYESIKHGAFLTFAHLPSDNATAPGQLDIETLTKHLES